ncbi:NAD(P)/FAD-dependent oxidoreductase [candidate division WOR-3 bacterium]|nr:NAD(P)/FAD-dependent oxidoreductase [candidate division WOR-3 bacterium]
MTKLDKYYDIVVVGAGPAGSAAAIAASKEKVRVLLIEEHKDIGIPVCCAEATSFEEIENFLKPKDDWIASSIDGVILTSPSKRSLIIHHPNAGFILNREIFDRDLALMAKEQGTEVITDSKGISVNSDGIKIIYKDKEIFVRAKIIIAADGISSLIGKKAGLDTELSKKDYWITYQYRLRSKDIRNHYVEIFLGREFAPGAYIWIFPKGEELANVGLAISPLLTKNSPKLFLDKFIKWRFNKVEIEGRSSGRLPSKFMTSIVKDNIVLVGDAARFVDPLTGGGIYNAILSGKLAGEVSIRAIKENDVSILKNYEKEWFKKKEREFRIKIKLKELCMKLTDDDIEIVYDFINKTYGGKTIYSFYILETAKKIITMSPKLLRFTKYLKPTLMK